MIVDGALQQHQHQQKTQGPTSSGPSSEIYEVTSEVISGVPTSSEIYEVLSSVISGAPTSSVIYEEISEVISGVPTSSQIYEVLSGSPSSSEIYELLSGSGPAVSQLSEDIYELLSGGPSSGGPSSGGSSVEISQVAKPAILGAKGQTSQVAPELRSNYDASLKNGGYSFEGAFGVNQRRRCDRGLIDRAATGIRNTVNGGVGNLMGAISSLTDSGTALGPVGGLVNAVGHAGGHLIQGKLNEIDFMVNDAACGLGNIANGK
ncbi:uncharacterized protein [Parasteatoda tepidariorum]|uniref:uncharacterized protein n=1 Tax=Parasteatoda tepidariorum TaxID=114398 RepID=UPI0039BCA354